MSTKKRPPRNATLAAEIRDRLEELRSEKGLSYTAFAKVGDVPWSQYNAWRNRSVVPGGFYVRRLAEKFGVTAGWLLGITGAPKYERQMRPKATLAEDLAVYVSREVGLKIPGAGAEAFTIFDPARFLADLIEEQIPAATENLTRDQELNQNYINAGLAGVSLITEFKKLAPSLSLRRRRELADHVNAVERERLEPFRRRLAQREYLGHIMPSPHFVAAFVSARGTAIETALNRFGVIASRKRETARSQPDSARSQSARARRPKGDRKRNSMPAAMPSRKR